LLFLADLRATFLTSVARQLVHSLRKDDLLLIFPRFFPWSSDVTWTNTPFTRRTLLDESQALVKHLTNAQRASFIV